MSSLPPRKVPSIGQLSPQRQALVALMRELHFGTIDALPVVSGEPVIGDPQTRVVRAFKLGHRDLRPEPSADYLLKDQVIHLLERLDALESGFITQLVVKNGLPFSMGVENNLSRTA
jgi:hypothetical protein